MPLINSPIDKALMTAIFDFQIEVLTGQSQHLLNLVKMMRLQTREDLGKVPTFLACYLEDHTWQAFKIESEQMTINDEEEVDDELQKKN
jgi:hypothetical protein